MSLPDGLGYLHDATVVSLTYRVVGEGDRVIELLARCNPDAGHPDWDGKLVRLTLDSVFVANWLLYGELFNDETIDRVGGILSDHMFRERQRLMNDGTSSAATAAAARASAGRLLRQPHVGRPYLPQAEPRCAAHSEPSATIQASIHGKGGAVLH